MKFLGIDIKSHLVIANYSSIIFLGVNLSNVSPSVLTSNTKLKNT